jgi:ubiquinone/menaquinone biosynthesis C-methylase UbiE
MKIEFQETTDDLLKRINIHDRFGSRSIDTWMLEILDLKPGIKILDLGCGAGKQCFSYYAYLNGDAEITGTDGSEDLLEQARLENKKTNDSISYVQLDFNKPFELPKNHFDLESCCFAIYYAQDIPFTISEMHRVLKPGGRLFTTGPMPQNKAVFYDIITEATGKPIPPMPGSSRYSTEIHGTIENLFSKVETHIFENPLVFDSAQPFIEYTRASLSEDRKLWNSFFTTHEDFEKIMSKISAVAKSRIEKDGILVMTKVVGGFLATK